MAASHPGSSQPSLEALVTRTHDRPIPFDDEDATTRLQEAERMPLPPDMPYTTKIKRLVRYMPHMRTLIGTYKHQQAGRICVVDVPALDAHALPVPQSGHAIPPALSQPMSPSSPTLSPQTPAVPASSPPVPPLPPAKLSFVKYMYPSLERHDALLTELKDLHSEDTYPITRLFIVEDLCPQLLEVVGQAFDSLHPEIFAEHLNGARHMEESSEEISSGDWNTCDLWKPFTTIKWYRPVRRRAGEYGISVHRDIQEVLSGSFQEPFDDDNADRDGNDDHGVQYLPAVMSRKTRKTGRARPRTTTNILRTSISLSEIHDLPNDSNIPFLWEEKATLMVEKNGPEMKVLFLLDPLPKLIYTAEGTEETKDILPYTASRKQRHPPWALPALANTKALLDSLQETNATADDLCLSFVRDLYNIQIDTPADPILSLLKIIHVDIEDSFKLMSTSLDSITTLSMDDFRMQESLNYWRELMNRMLKIVQALTEGYQRFAAETYTPMPENVKKLMNDVEREAEQLVKKIRLCQSGLRADMSILESRRGIAEAESVTRLTELAFIFIPLSFVSSLFSMQIYELQSGVPLTHFVKAGVIVIIVIYGIRLLARARLFKRLRRASMSAVRNMNGLGPNDPIPLFGILKFLIRWMIFGNAQVWVFWLFFAAFSISIIPVALLWSRSKLDVSFKAMGTIVLVPTGFLLAWILASVFITEYDSHASWSLGALLQQRASITHRRSRGQRNAQA